jgi:hypothetical protein
MTTKFVDYAQVLTDARAAIETANLGFVKVTKNADDFDLVNTNMPIVDLRWLRAQPVDVGGQNYYSELVIEAEILASDMTSLDKAATIRDDLTGLLQRWFQTNPHFSGASDSVVVGNAEFGTGQDAKTGAFVAVVLLEFHVMLYTNQG